jgi:prevent-host-death family protein
MDEQSPPSTKKITAMQARHAFGQLLNEVYYKGDLFIIERDGKPMAAVIPLSQLEALQKFAPSPKLNKRKAKRTR